MPSLENIQGGIVDMRPVAPSSPPPPPPSSFRYRLLDRAAIMATKPIQWRVKGLLPTTGTGAIYGPSSSGKSFLGADLGIFVALGRPWFGHRTTPCPVTYIMLEGEAGARNRVAAWEKHNGGSIPANFQFIIQPVRLAELQDVEDLGAALPKNGMVIIDTLNRSAPGMDENSSADMGRLLAGMKRLQEIIEGLVLVVHHTGKDASKGMRGHSSLHAALDGAIEVERTANGRSWSAAKVKDGEDGALVPFKLHVIDLGTDVDGDKITSCAVGPDTSALFAPKVPSGKNQRVGLSAIRQALGTSISTGKAGSGSQTQCLNTEDAITAVAATLVAVVKNKRSNQARRIVGDLIAGGYLQSGLDAYEDAWVW